ncbi:MAG: DNA/RNA non-specific endonuclease [Clostridia bacterium]|nr:DNA/RNA non-specific endonuclease [Clostridia bacterium]
MTENQEINSQYENRYIEVNEQENSLDNSIEISEIPEFSGSVYIEINNNIPNFSEEDLSKSAFESYSELDSLGRCGVAYAKLGKETMPKENEERGSISNVKPTGWINKKYPKVVDGNYLYNRCHLIAHSLSAENANEKNLITGTRYFNVNGMLDFETDILEYLKNNKQSHVMYRVSPVFEGENLLAKGVQMEAKSVEDGGKQIQFNVFVYNIQPGIQIDYKTGESKLMEEAYD